MESSTTTQGQRRKQLDITKRECSNINREFGLELRNRFRVLSTTTEEEDHDVEGKWNTIKNIYCEIAKHVIGYRRKKKKEWLTHGTWQKIDERKQLKNTLLHNKSPRLQEQAQKAYKKKDMEVKRSARTDKKEVGQNAIEMSVLYKITKRICGNNINQSAPVKDNNSNALIIERKQAARCVQHQLNQPTPHQLMMSSKLITAHLLKLKLELPSDIKSGKVLLRCWKLTFIHRLTSSRPSGPRIPSQLAGQKALLSNYQRKEISKMPTTGEG